MKILVDITWRLLHNSSSGSTYRGTGTAFDTDTLLIEPYTLDRYVALLDPAPVDVHWPVGWELHSTCAPDFTRTVYVFDGGTQYHVVAEPNSPTCGYAPPATCELGTATVSQQATAGGARLTASLSGTSNGALYYSLDGGVEQLTPVFNQVAPGPHTIRLRDEGLAGCERLVSVTVAPPPTAPAPPAAPAGASEGVDFVAQPLFYALAGQAPDAQVDLELWAESAHTRGDYALVLTKRKRCDAQGAVRFQLDELLLPLLSAFVPPAGVHPVDQVSQACTPNLVNYYVRTTSLSPAAGALPVYEVSALRTALRGGLPLEWQHLDYFALRLVSFDYPPFLSWQPTGPGTYAGGAAKAVVPRQPEWLCWLVPAEVGSQQLRVRRRYVMSAGGVPVSDYELLATPAGGWGLRLLAIPLKDGRAGFAELSVRVETLSGLQLSPEAVYRFEEAGPRTRYLLFTNSLGGLDTLRCTGRLDYALEAAAASVETPRLGPAPTAERRVADVAATRKLRLLSGWLTPAELDWAQEVVLSRELWHYVGQQLRPLDAAKRSLAAYSDEPGLRGLALDFDYAYALTAYAPVPYA